jgi:hypothetical protein
MLRLDANPEAKVADIRSRQMDCHQTNSPYLHQNVVQK